MESVDKIIDFLLEYCVMSEDRVCCYLADELRNMIQEKAGNDIFVIYSGSKQEGVNNTNDIDLMISQPDFIVVESTEHVQAQFEDILSGVLLMETEDCYPGFARLLVHCEPHYEMGDVYTEYQNKKYLDSKKYLQFTSERLLKRKDFEMHGPAILISDEKADIVICLTCPILSKFSNSFLCRPRLSQNPSEKVIEDIISVGCHVVAIPHPQSENPNLEFRISFSVAEKHLIREWSNKQLKCYFVLKELVKKYLGSNEEIKKGLCSYFVKTLMFWANEEYNEEFWEQNSTLYCVKKLLEKLKCFIVQKKCPNYFIAENLMVSSYSSDQIELISHKIEQVRTNVFTCVLCSHAFEEFFNQYDVMVSIYETLFPLGEEEKFDEIMENVFVTLKHNVEKKITTKAVKMKFLNNQLSDFVTFCLHRTWIDSCNPISVLHNVLDSLEQFRSKNPMMVQYFINCIQRSIALHTLEIAFNLPESEQQMELFLKVESLLISSAQMSGFMNDYNFSGYVHLALFHYVLGNIEKSKQLLEASIHVIKQISIQSTYNLLALPVILCGTQHKGPTFLKKDKILTDVFEKLNLRCVEFDPLMLVTYLLYKITGKKDILRKFTEMDLFITKARASTRKSYDYIRYKLGMIDNEPPEFTHLEF